MAKRRTLGNFFSFRWMITPGVIKTIYVLELILFNLVNIGLSLSVIAAIILLWDYTGLEMLWMIVTIVVWIIWRLFWWVLANILLRMVFELVILPFSMHEMLSTIEGDVRESMSARAKEAKAGKGRDGAKEEPKASRTTNEKKKEEGKEWE